MQPDMKFCIVQIQNIKRQKRKKYLPKRPAALKSKKKERHIILKSALTKNPARNCPIAPIAKLRK